MQPRAMRSTRGITPRVSEKCVVVPHPPPLRREIGGCDFLAHIENVRSAHERCKQSVGASQGTALTRRLVTVVRQAKLIT